MEECEKFIVKILPAVNIQKRLALVDLRWRSLK